MNAHGSKQSAGQSTQGCDVRLKSGPLVLFFVNFFFCSRGVSQRPATEEAEAKRGHTGIE